MRYTIRQWNNYYLNLNKGNIKLFIGDININLMDNNKEVNNYINILTEHDFIPYINKPK